MYFTVAFLNTNYNYKLDITISESNTYSDSVN